MAVGVFAILALQQPLEVIIPSADVAGLVQRIVEFFIETGFLDRRDSLSVADTREVGPAVGTPIRKLAALQNAGVAKGVLAAKPSYIFLVEQLQVAQTYRTFLRVLIPAL